MVNGTAFYASLQVNFLKKNMLKTFGWFKNPPKVESCKTVILIFYKKH